VSDVSAPFHVNVVEGSMLNTELL
jgi:hypothetical protein